MGAKSHISVAAAFLASTALAQAQDVQRFSDIETVEVADFIGTVRVTTGGDDVRVTTRMGADRAYPVNVAAANGALVVSSDEDPDETRWHDDVDWRKYNDAAFARFLETYPTLDIVIPEGAALVFDSAVIALTADDTKGAFSIDEGYVDGRIGAVASGDIAVHSSADLEIGDVAGALAITIHGSGDVKAGDAGPIKLAIHGSGDVLIGNVAGDAKTAVHGSGDIEIGDIAGAVQMSVHGSGDVKSANVGGGADLSVQGSGDFFLASVSGKTDVHIHGSGDIVIDGGRAEDLKVRINGSGDFAHNGVATNPDIAVHGSGSARVARHDGVIRTAGRGDIRISGVDYGEDD